MNAQNFDDCEKTSSNLQLCFLKSLFEWIFVYALLNVSQLSRVLCSFFLLLILMGIVLLYTSCILLVYLS